MASIPEICGDGIPFPVQWKSRSEGGGCKGEEKLGRAVQGGCKLSLTWKLGQGSVQPFIGAASGTCHNCMSILGCSLGLGSKQVPLMGQPSLSDWKVLGKFQ